MLLDHEKDRIERGEPVSLVAVATAWAEAYISRGHATFHAVQTLTNQIGGELQDAVRTGRVGVYDSLRKRIRPYRDDDESRLSSGHVWISPTEVDTWLRAENLEPLYQSSTPSTSPVAADRGTPSKLTESQKQAIVSRYNRGRGESVAKLARAVRVSRRTIDTVLIRAGVKQGKRKSST